VAEALKLGMESSVSYIMEYSRRRRDTRDWVGGLPAHLPDKWPQCQRCQERMGFVGQLYASDWFPIDGHLALQFYVCDECRTTFKKMANDDVPIHMEELHSTAPANTKRIGARCKSQPKLYISYVPVEDSMDQWTFNRRKLAEIELPDKHLRKDKIGGLFPYDDYECPKITKRNRMIAQFTWHGIGGAIYLYQSTKNGIYLYHYR
jgi:hypothetical protein